MPGPFCDMEYPEDTQIFYEYALPDMLPLILEKIYGYEGNEYIAGGGDNLVKNLHKFTA